MGLAGDHPERSADAVGAAHRIRRRPGSDAGRTLAPHATVVERRTRRDLLVGSLFSVLASVCGAAGGVLSRRAYEVAHATGEHLDGGNAGFQRVLGGLLLGGICL